MMLSNVADALGRLRNGRPVSGRFFAV